MAVIEIADFRGGRNTVGNQLLINPSNCVATSVNVWAPDGSLTKVPGYGIHASFTATAINMGRIVFDNAVNTAFNIYSRLASSVVNGDYNLWAGETDALTPLGYVTGTVSISGGSLISATGSGTSWSTHVTAGDLFRVNSTADKWYRVSSVEDDTHLTLSGAVPVAVATGSAYTALLRFTRIEQADASLDGSLWMTTENDWMQRYDGSGVTRIPAAPRAAFLAVFKNYVFGFRSITAESRLYWSAIKNPASWPTNNFIDIDKDSGKGSGLIAYGNELICMKTNSMHKVVGEIFDPSNPTFAVYPISTPPDFRFNAAKSLVIHNGALYFIANSGIYVYQQGTNFIARISDAITFDLPVDVGDFNDLTANSQRYSGLSFEGALIFKGSLGTNPGYYFALIMDRAGAWWRVHNTNETSTISPLDTVPMVALPQTAGRSKLITGSRQKPRLYNWDMATAFINNTATGTFLDPNAGSGTNINAEWRSKEFNVEYGHFKTIVVYCKKQTAGSLTVGWSIDQSAFVTAAADMTSGRGNMIRQTFNINQKGSTIQVQFIQNDARMNVYAAKVYYDPILENRQA